MSGTIETVKKSKLSITSARGSVATAGGGTISPDVPSLSDLLTELAPAAAAAAAASPTGDLSLSGLIPPTGSLYGYSSFPSAFQLGIPPWLVPNGKGQITPDVDDKLLWTDGQTSNSQCLTEFYIYWVNGMPNPSENAYYLVILRQSGSMSPGAITGGNNNPNCDGYFQYRFTVGNSPVQINNSTPSSGWSLIQHSPTGTTNDSVSPSISVPMTLYGNTGSGMGPIQFTAEASDQVTLTDWQVVDNVGQNGNATTLWTFQQYSPWAASDLDTFSVNFPSCFNSEGAVLNPSIGAYSAVSYDVVTVWTFDSSLFTMPANPLTTAPSLPVTFTLNWESWFSDFHNAEGCNGAYGGFHAHCLVYALATDAVWDIDLGQIINSQSSQS